MRLRSHARRRVYVERKKCYLSDSTLKNAGRGIFASVDIAAGEIITAYSGYVLNPRHNRGYDNSYAMTHFYKSRECTLIGFSDILTLQKNRQLGIAQLANDAMIYSITGKNNNSYFIEKSSQTVLVAVSPIKAHEEILVSYGYEYWVKSPSRRREIGEKNWYILETALIFRNLLDNALKTSSIDLVYRRSGVIDLFLGPGVSWECTEFNHRTKSHWIRMITFFDGTYCIHCPTGEHVEVMSLK